jgi:hypothetical protein
VLAERATRLACSEPAALNCSGKSQERLTLPRCQVILRHCSDLIRTRDLAMRMLEKADAHHAAPTTSSR